MDHESKIEALQWEVIRNSNSTKAWSELASAVSAAPYSSAASRVNVVTTVLERAVRAIPYSYKLWTRYIAFRLSETKLLCTPHEWFQSVRDLYQRALERLPQMPLLWVSYMEFVMHYPKLRVTMVRHIIGQSLQALPATQHHHIWKRARKWCCGASIPEGTFTAIWTLYLLFDTSTEAKTQYLAQLLQRGSKDKFLCACVDMVSAASSKAKDNTNNSTTTTTSGDAQLVEDMNFWEPVRVVLQAPGWRYTGSVPALESLIAMGCKHCASPLGLQISFASFLYGQGHIREGRDAFMRLLNHSPDPESFALAYAVAVESEDQLVESFALSDSVHALDDAAYGEVHAALFGASSPTPFAAVEKLVSSYPLLLNQAQLRCNPQSVSLWLKRAELVMESVFAGGGATTADDVTALYRQAIAQCTAGMEEVDVAAAQLYDSLACHLLECGHLREAISTLTDGALHVSFTSVAGNLSLFGLLLEVMLMSSNSLSSVVSFAVEKLQSAKHITSNHRPARSGGLLSQSVLTRKMRGEPRAWQLLADLCITCHDIKALQEVSDTFASSSSRAYTAEGAVYMAHCLWSCGLVDAASRHLENALGVFSSNPAAIAIIADQYMSYLITTHEDLSTLPLHVFREVCRVVDGASNSAIAVAPVRVVDLLLCCAFLESRLGLYGNAVRILQSTAIKLIAANNNNNNSAMTEDDSTALAECVIERAIVGTHAYKGLPEMRQYCQQLVSSVQNAGLVYRVALNWAAVEKRSGNVEQAHLVLDACGDSQDPRTTRGKSFWGCWESLCTTVQEMDKLMRRKQQVMTKFEKKEKK